MIRRPRPRVVIQDDVVQFPLDLLCVLLGFDYACEASTLDPRRLGWPVARTRRYAIFTRTDLGSPRVSLACIAPLLAAAMPAGDATTFAVVPATGSPPSERELNHLANYQSPPATRPRRVVVDLDQNSLKRPRGSNVDHAICTITCSLSRLYVVDEGRFLTGDELMMS